MASKDRKVSKRKIAKPKKVHPWRPCPLGQHWVITHPYHVRPSKRHPSGSTAVQRGHCRTNRSKKDQLYKDDIQEIAQRHFSQLKGAPAADNLGFGRSGNNYDEFIRGWTRYWNDVLDPKDPLDPDLVKALIASESSFDPNAWNHRTGRAGAHGLMQVLNGSVELLGNPHELKDHFVNLTEDDMTDPNLNICAGVRWLFRKKQLAEALAHTPVSWRDAVAAYKNVKTTDKRLMPKFDDFYSRLRGKK